MTKPLCPHHGNTMKSMEDVGAPRWFVCTARDPMPCGYSQHAEPVSVRQDE